MKLEYIASKKDAGKTIKDILLNEFKISHRLLITLKKQNTIFVNGVNTHIYKGVAKGDNITISFNYDEDNSNIVPKKMPLNIVYEDDWLLIINKPAGVAIHPSILHYEDSLSNGIRYYFDSINLKKKIRPVNRLDKDTSGLVVFAKNEYVQEALIKQMKTGDFKKEYIAVVEGHFFDKLNCNQKYHIVKSKTSGTVNAPIARKENSIIERCVLESGSISITHYEVLKESEINNLPISIVHCTLETGRTHQIRVHMSYIHHPLLGDDLYGGNTDYIKRQALHSYKVSFIHPITKHSVVFSSLEHMWLPSNVSLKKFYDAV